MAQILYDARWIGNHGIGRFAAELQKRLPTLATFDANRKPWHPFDPWMLGASLRRLRPRAFFSPGYNSPLGWSGEFVFTLHDLNHLCVPANSNSLKRAYYGHVIRPACHRAAAVLTVSDYSRQEIVEWAGLTEDRVLSVGNGVGFPFTPLGNTYYPGFPYLLYVGSRKPHKNLDRLLEAYACSGVQEEVQFLVSGSPDAQIQAEAARLGITGHVRYLEIPDNDLLASVYRGAVAFLFPSLYEGFGLPPVEAMACGAPVLASNICSLPEVVGDAAILIDPLSVDDIAAGIRSLVDDQDLRTNLKQRGLQRVKALRWENTARRISEVLSRVTGEAVPYLIQDELSHDHPVASLMATTK